MQAFMSGRIQVEGDVIRVMALQAGPADLELAEEIASALEAITD
jgi:putative sterol carrier protein